MDFTADIKGMPEIDLMFAQIGPRIADRIMQAGVKDVAVEGRDDAKSRAPIRTRTLVKAIKAKSERAKPGLFVATVYVEKGPKATNDAWYWHFVEFGTVNSPPYPFITPAYDNMLNKLKQGNFSRVLGKRIIKSMAAARRKATAPIGKKRRSA
jgi:HK97 gp10 family phage protein